LSQGLTSINESGPDPDPVQARTANHRNRASRSGPHTSGNQLVVAAAENLTRSRACLLTVVDALRTVLADGDDIRQGELTTRWSQPVIDLLASAELARDVLDAALAFYNDAAHGTTAAP